MLSTDKQTNKQTNQRYQKHNLLCQGCNNTMPFDDVTIFLWWHVLQLVRTQHYFGLNIFYSEGKDWERDNALSLFGWWYYVPLMKTQCSIGEDNNIIFFWWRHNALLWRRNSLTVITQYSITGSEKWKILYYLLDSGDYAFGSVVCLSTFLSVVCWSVSTIT